MSTSSRPRGLVARVVERSDAIEEWWKNSRPGRAAYHYIYARGALLSGGIAYSALFSLFAILTIGYTIFIRVLGGREELVDTVFDRFNAAVPGLIDTGQPGGGAIEPSELLLSPSTSITGAIAVVVLLFSAASFMYHLRLAVRTMFGVSDVGQNSVLGRLRGLVGFFLLAVVVVVAAALSLAASTLSDWVLGLLGITGGAAVVVTVVGLVVSVLLDAVVVTLVVVFLGAVPVRRRDLAIGALAAGVVFGVLRYLGSTLVAGSASNNPLFASFAVIGTLLVLVNLLSRILLMICAWMANPPREYEPDGDGPRHARDGRPELPVVDEATTSTARHLRAGHGSGMPWSPVVRGIRRGRAPREH